MTGRRAGLLGPKPPFDPGEYLGFVDLPLGSAQAVFDLQPDRPPRLVVHDYGPTTWGGFPKPAVDLPRITGRLRTNQDIVLGNVLVADWGQRQHHGSAGWALVGFEVSSHIEWERADVQVSGLELLMRRPMDEVHWPKDGLAERQQYSAVVAPYPVAESAHGDMSVRPSYSVSFSMSDPYQHRVSTVATTMLRADERLTVDQWISEWIQPLTTLVGVGTGRVETLRTVTLRNGEFVPANRADFVEGVLFGSGITQDPQLAERQLDKRGDPVVPLFVLDESPPLATLIATWREASQDLSALPLLRLSQDPELHPSIRFLLLAQAAESHTPQPSR